MEFLPSKRAKITGWVFVFGGALFIGIGAYHFATGAPLIFNTGSHATGTDYVGSDFEVMLFMLTGALPILFGGCYLMWCRNARISLVEEGVVIRNWRGLVTARVPWEAITAIDSEVLRNGEPELMLRTADRKMRLSRFENLDVLAEQIRSRAQNMGMV